MKLLTGSFLRRIQLGDRREVIQSKRLLHPEESHFIVASCMQNSTDIYTF